MTQRTEIGDVLRIETTIRDIAGALADPGQLTFTMNSPGGGVRTFAYGINPELGKSAIGVYYVDWLVTATGTHRYAWSSTGANAAYSESGFVAQPRRVVAAIP